MTRQLEWIMKTKIVVIAALIVASAAARAADLPHKAPAFKAPVTPVYDWTGFHVGVNAGIGTGRNPSGLDAVDSFERFHLAPFGGIGGGQIGYNWQFGSWVIGLETDIQAANLRDTPCLLQCNPAARAAQYTQELDWFGTVRARIGLARGPVLGYVTGGLAYGDVKTSITETFFPTIGTFSTSDTRTGYTIGSGVEASLGGNWTGKIEHLYIDLGEQNIAYTIVGMPRSFSTDIRQHVFRGGLNYRFGGNSTYTEPVRNWSGFYLGGNGGSAYARNPASYTVGAAPAPFSNEDFKIAPEGFFGGVQAGYNFQTGNWVFGVEADFQGSAQKDDRPCVLACGPAVAALIEQKMPWFGTVRGRLGYTVGSTLFYGTGGFAYGKVETAIDSLAGATLTSTKFSRTTGGWTAGAGIERPLQFFNWFGPNWTTKTEYLYIDLGRSSDGYQVAPNVPATFTTKVQEHIFRTGISYNFNSPVAARY